jgi:hypothetical protein
MFPRMGWNPWRYIGEHYPHITVVRDRELPGRIWGLTDGRRIWICRRLNQAQRRSTLAHELLHIERGLPPTDPRGLAREEKIVSALAARRLIALPDLIEALKWTREPAELADALWVDTDTVRARMNSLDPIEVAQLEHALEGQWIP